MKQHKIFLSIAVFYLLLFLPFIGQVHLFDWDEINFAEAAREMLVSGDWLNVQINFEPFWEKPPFFIWAQALSMKVFGVNAFAARLPNVIIGLLTLAMLYYATAKRYGYRPAVVSVFLYIGSITPHFYFKTGIIDPLFNLLMFASVLSMIRAIETKRSSGFAIAGLVLGLAVITKGPVALLLVGLTGLLYQVVYRHTFYSLRSLLLLLLGLLTFPAIYFGALVSQSGWWFLSEFFVYQIDLFRYPIASHGQPFYYHMVVLLIGCFPLAILAIKPLMRRMPGNQDFLLKWSKLLFWVVLVVFSLVTTKIVHYSSMCYLPMAVVGGVWLERQGSWSKWQSILMGVVGVLWSTIFALIGGVGLNLWGIRAKLGSYVNDAFVREQLSSIHSESFIPLLLAIVLLVFTAYLVKLPNLKTLLTFLVFNTLIISFFVVSSVPTIERAIQGEWIAHLKTYKQQPMVHFTDGFKSYAPYFYTECKPLTALDSVRNIVLKEQGYGSYNEMNQFEKKEYDAQLRYYVIYKTEIPFTLSAKRGKYEELKAHGVLERVFSGNGYDVWQRSTRDPLRH